jgi:hypothetical protein
MKFRQLITAIMAVVMIIIFTQKANSQVLISLLLGDKLNTEKLKFGLDGGLNYSSISNIDPSKYRPNFNLGFYFDFLLKKDMKWYVHTGVLVKSSMGARGLDPYVLNDASLDTLFQNGKIDRKLSYFNVPILVRYKFKNELFVEAGAKLGLLYKAYDIFYNEIDEKKDLSYNYNVRDQYNRIDAGVEAGIGYNVIKGTGYNFGLRYYYGLNGLLKDNSGDPQRNSSIYLFASLPVGAGEKAKAKAEAKKVEKQEKKEMKEKKKK